MTWVRYDDQASIHRKVAPLDDATYRLWREATEWCARNLTDGRIAADELGVTSKRANAARAAKLVARDLWHTAEAPRCRSEHCPEPGKDGWVIHDYFDYQFTREKVERERAGKSARQQRWRAKVAGVLSDSARDASVDASRPPSVTPAPSPTPSPKEGVARARPADRCPKHRDDPDPPPCGPCADARRAAEAWDTDRRTRGAALPPPSDTARCRQHRGQPAANCAICRSERLAKEPP